MCAKVNGVSGDASANVGALATDGGAQEPSAQNGDAKKMRLVEPGAEPRVARRYAFAAGKSETRVGSVRVSVTIEAAGQPPQQQQQPALELTMKLAAKAPTKAGALFDVKLDKVALAEGQGLDPRAAADVQKQLAPLIGLTAKFDVSRHTLTKSRRIGRPCRTSRFCFTSRSLQRRIRAPRA